MWGLGEQCHVSVTRRNTSLEWLLGKMEAGCNAVQDVDMILVLAKQKAEVRRLM